MSPDSAILVTGGAGFIGSTFIRQWLESTSSPVVNLDCFTYAGNRLSVEEMADSPRYTLCEGDINDATLLMDILEAYRPEAVVHLAAESHVDRSIQSPNDFVASNVAGTCCLLEASHRYWDSLTAAARERFRFLYVSTDEVFGPSVSGERFNEQSAANPVSPYAATKSGGEQLSLSFHKTYGLPVLVANPSNNYGPRQHPEKLIPKMTLAAAAGEPITLYGDGLQQRDWLHVDDCCSALREILMHADPGDRFIVATGVLSTNLEVVGRIQELVAESQPGTEGPRSEIRHIADRLGHDRQYALDNSLLKERLGWKPLVSFDQGLKETVEWYLTNNRWLEACGGNLPRSAG